MVTDRKAYVDGIATYLGHIKKTLHRQVDLEAQIFEVVLNDEFHFGIDWENVMTKVGEWAVSSGGLASGIPSTRLIVDNPIGGGTPGQPALSLAITKGESVKAFKTQFFDPHNEEHETFISKPTFLGFLEGRAKEFGQAIGVSHGEGFTSARQLGVGDLFRLA